MNELAEKVVAAHTDDEMAQLIDDHYVSDSQTLTSGKVLDVATLDFASHHELRAHRRRAPEDSWWPSTKGIRIILEPCQPFRKSGIGAMGATPSRPLRGRGSSARTRIYCPRTVARSTWRAAWAGHPSSWPGMGWRSFHGTFHARPLPSYGASLSSMGSPLRRRW